MIRFFQRPYPSANAVLLPGPRPVLVDPGFGADVPALLDWLVAEGVRPEALALVVNTHSHCDHAGGNHELQARFGLTVAASGIEAAAVNARDPDACRAQWLHQPVEAYRVGQMLAPGDRIATGDADWTVLATPGHTAGHLSLYDGQSGTLVLGDALHDADLGWLNLYREGPDPLRAAGETIAHLERLPARRGYSGHGPAIADLPSALARARRRLRSWREQPERIAWHACKRIFSHALMLEGGVTEAGVAPMLLACPWFHDHARLAFGLEPAAFVPLLVAETLRAGGAAWQAGRLVALAPYTPIRPGWPESEARPGGWG